MIAVTPLVSVLIPAHNEADDIAAAIESVLHQRTRFPVEVLVIDDGSTDRTAEIAENYATRHPSLHVLRNDAKKGKGYSVRRAYNQARGKYIHVLDADDIFSNWDKLQRQVDILCRRTDCFAVAHNTLFLTQDDRVRIVPGCAADTIYRYAECYRNRFYCHTSSYLFRRLDKGLPDYFERETMRGDAALFFFHAFATRKSVYVMKQVMSVYNIHGQGIWSSLDQRTKDDFNSAILRDLKTLVVQDPERPEHKSLEKRIAWHESKKQTPVPPTASETSDFRTIDDLVRDCERTAASVFRPEIRAHAFQAMYSLPDVDTLMETVGRAALMRDEFRLAARQYDPRRAALLVSGFVPNGGGVFREIKEIVGQLLSNGFRIDILSSGKIDTEREIIDTHFADPAIRYRQLDTNCPPLAQIAEALRFLAKAAPDRIYPFITHHDVIGLAAMQRGLGREVVFDYVYDHGLSLGVNSSAIDQIVAKTHTQASALAAVIEPSRIGLLAPFFTDRFGASPYRPLASGMLTTASAAARSYKVESEYRYGYFDVMIAALSAVNMRHIHYGPLSPGIKADLLDRLREARVAEDRFVHIPWADDLGCSLLKNGVDVFISPFPICSARIGIEVMCCGIPSLNHRASLPGLPEAGDFVDPAQPEWATPEDLIDSLSQMDAARLQALSASARAYFCAHNASSVSLRRFVDGEFDTPEIDPSPRFMLNDLALEPFFDSRLAEVGAEQLADDSRWPKFWHRTRARRRVRAMFHRLRGNELVQDA